MMPAKNVALNTSHIGASHSQLAHATVAVSGLETIKTTIGVTTIASSKAGPIHRREGVGCGAAAGVCGVVSIGE